MYITPVEALDLTIDSEHLFKSGDIEKALALKYCRSLIFDKALDIIKKDIERIHGNSNSINI